ncbi:polysaccharide pyruvyl transferase family protein [Pseudorhodoferax sp.]|uniref:polysaccharide pyruvyl transferase family protein n=1 Tax=Pseudorhodoferax sp. TaxID=1993553 RepID=UPI002DD6B7B4|nr:polysaccharide pyruvyl transferase family protein [Pseudorhodoferax sp.]
MELCYYRDPKFNFGDDLNAVVWPQVLSEQLRNHPDIVLVGIGSILNETMVGKHTGQGKRIVVIGSGTSYGVPPQRLDELEVLAVRGPYTAAVIGKPRTAVTDSAILLAQVDAQRDVHLKKDLVLFMPHHRTIASTPWAEIARECGLTYVSPQQPVEDILQQFAHARLVVTEAMHGAIVADTLRIPWIPLAISPAVEEFKWRDWCLSMNLPFQPQRLPAGSYRDLGRFAHMERLLRQARIHGFDNIPHDASPQALRAYLARRFTGPLQDLSWRRPAVAVRALNRMLSVADGIPRKAAVQALARATRGEQFMSKDSVFRGRLQQMLDAVGRAEQLAA